VEGSADIRISRTVTDRVPTLFVGTRILRDVYVTYTPPDVEEVMDALVAEWAGTTEGELDAHPMILSYRELRRQLGADPAKAPPAVETLLRRGVLQGRFPRVNSLVDAANIVSMRHLVPIGLFDYDRIAGPVELTLAVSGDRFIPIGKKNPIKLSPGTPVLRDREGIFSAVGSRDSVRTMITPGTENALIVSWGLEGIDPGFISSVLDECAGEIQR
jgi:DNA/RNA-binding domain of Phe-tRNA-synthetase-like protein